MHITLFYMEFWIRLYKYLFRNLSLSLSFGRSLPNYIISRSEQREIFNVRLMSRDNQRDICALSFCSPTVIIASKRPRNSLRSILHIARLINGTSQQCIFRQARTKVQLFIRIAVEGLSDNNALPTALKASLPRKKLYRSDQLYYRPFRVSDRCDGWTQPEEF